MKRARTPAGRGSAEAEVPWASFADALTGLLFVFILLALGFAYELEKMTAKARARETAASAVLRQREKAARIARQLVSRERGSAETRASVAICLEDLLEDRVEVSPTVEESRLSLYPRRSGASSSRTTSATAAEELGERDPLTIEWFGSGSARLDPGPCDVAQKIGPCILRALLHPALTGTATSAGGTGEFVLRVFVEGHTDSVPVSGGPAGIPTNWELSGARAAAVVRAFLAPPDPGGREATCPAPASDAAELEQRIARGELEVVAVGLADRRPAWKRLCQARVEDPVCACLERSGGEADACSEVLGASAGGTLPGDALASTLLVDWANLEEATDADVRRRFQRRVDLRFEVVPRSREPSSR
jgi:hypothetical protein